VPKSDNRVKEVYISSEPASPENVTRPRRSKTDRTPFDYICHADHPVVNLGVYRSSDVPCLSY
jgi:hypothetical protein